MDTVTIIYMVFRCIVVLVSVALGIVITVGIIRRFSRNFAASRKAKKSDDSIYDETAPILNRHAMVISLGSYQKQELQYWRYVTNSDVYAAKFRLDDNKVVECQMNPDEVAALEIGDKGTLMTQDGRFAGFVLD